jgi:hypothetical protein
MLRALKDIQARRVVYAAGTTVPAETFSADEVTALQADGLIEVVEDAAPAVDADAAAKAAAEAEAKAKADAKAGKVK